MLFTDCFQESEKIFDYLSNCVVFLFFVSRPFHENFKFLKNCPYDFHKTLHSHSTPKGAPACAMASKSYYWNVRNSQNSPKNGQKTAIFRLFSIFSKTVDTIQTKLSTVILHHSMVLCVQFHQFRMTAIRASWKEKDLSRLLYRICGSGLSCQPFFSVESCTMMNVIEHVRTIPNST